MRTREELTRRDVAKRSAKRRPRQRSLAVALSLLGAFTAPGIINTVAHADSIDDKRAEAEAIANEIAANGTKISMLDEELLDSRIQIEELNTQVAAADAEIAVAKTKIGKTNLDLKERATSLYMTGGSSAALMPALDGADFGDAGARQLYLEIAAQKDTVIIDDLQTLNKQLKDQIAILEIAQTAVAAEQTRLDDAKSDLEAANARQEELLAETRGELADLIAEEQARQERIAEEAARREQQEREEQERLDREHAEQNPSDPGTGNGSDIEVVAPNPRAQTAVDAALSQLGKPYSWATPGSWNTSNPSSFDCSGLTGWSWYQAGYTLSHSSRAQFAELPHVAQSDLLPGDLVFYGSPIHHVGMYIGGGEYVNAPQTGDVVKISSIYRSDWAGAARVPG